MKALYMGIWRVWYCIRATQGNTMLVKGEIVKTQGRDEWDGWIDRWYIDDREVTDRGDQCQMLDGKWPFNRWVVLKQYLFILDTTYNCAANWDKNMLYTKNELMVC